MSHVCLKTPPEIRDCLHPRPTMCYCVMLYLYWIGGNCYCCVWDSKLFGIIFSPAMWVLGPGGRRMSNISAYSPLQYRVMYSPLQYRVIYSLIQANNPPLPLLYPSAVFPSSGRGWGSHQWALIWYWDHLKNFIAEIPQGPSGMSIGTIWMAQKRFQGPPGRGFWFF